MNQRVAQSTRCRRSEGQAERHATIHRASSRSRRSRLCRNSLHIPVCSPRVDLIRLLTDRAHSPRDRRADNGNVGRVRFPWSGNRNTPVTSGRRPYCRPGCGHAGLRFGLRPRCHEKMTEFFTLRRRSAKAARPTHGNNEVFRVGTGFASLRSVRSGDFRLDSLLPKLATSQGGGQVEVEFETTAPPSNNRMGRAPIDATQPWALSLSLM